MYVGGPLDTAPATPSSTPSRSQASHREVKVRKVNPSHSPSLPAEYREASLDSGTGSRTLSRKVTLLLATPVPRSSGPPSDVLRTIIRTAYRWSSMLAPESIGAENLSFEAIGPVKQ